MRDVQSGPAEVDLDIDRVGVKGLEFPLTVRDRASGSQNTVARVDMSVALPAAFKGTHMSRFVEALGQWRRDLDYASCRQLLDDVCRRLGAESAHVRFAFPYFLSRSAPSSKSASTMHYDCVLDGELAGGRLEFTLSVAVPVMTVCPCSLAISDQGAHSQRAVVTVTSRFSGFVWLEELIDIAERAASSPVYSLLKRTDEKSVTEAAFDRPMFVEDVVRAAARELADHKRVRWFRVEVESFESIHNHSAFASIEIDKEREPDPTRRE